MKKLLSVILIALFTPSLGSCKQKQLPAEEHQELRSVYYWKTTFNLDSADMDFVKFRNIGRMYVRLFDVVVDSTTVEGVKSVVPEASLVVNEDYYNRHSDSISSMIDFVPVVYITLEALKNENSIGSLAGNIVRRAKSMCAYNNFGDIREIQLDCDWTKGTEKRFFALCDSVKKCVSRDSLDWKLSSTIRLHQLSQQAPPVDRGVLMVYNTGSFDNPDEANSIISADAVRPYLKQLGEYPLHLDIAYPTYSWQLLFRNRKFRGIVSGAPLDDKSLFKRNGEHSYEALQDIALGGNRMLLKGDVVRSETSGYKEIMAIKSLIDAELQSKPHSNILYHFDLSNLNSYTSDEIDNMLR